MTNEVSDSSICLVCSKTLPPDSKFCDGCGTKLEGNPASLPAVIPQSAEEAAPLSAIECPRCAEEIPADSKSCHHCGSVVGEAQPPVLPVEIEIKDCPFCGEQIKKEAIKCRHCQSDLRAHTKSELTQKIDPPMPSTKRCPDCAEEILSAAKKCKHCGSEFGKPVRSAPRAEPLQNLTPQVSQTTVIISDRLIRPDTSPLLVFLLSICCFAGLGQMVMGQIGKAIVIMIFTAILASCTMGISLIITWPLILIDAVCIAGKLKRGQSVGRWECF